MLKEKRGLAVAIGSTVLVLIGQVCLWGIEQLSIDLADKIILCLPYILICYIYMIATCIIRRGISNFYFIFLALSVFFYFGQHILVLTAPEYLLFQQDYTILDGRIPDEIIMKATFFIIKCMLLVNAGFCYVSVEKYNKVKNEAEEDIKIRSLKMAGWIILFISILPTCKLLFGQYRLMQEYGYLGRRMLETDGDYYSVLGASILENYIAGLFLPAIYALLIAYRGKRNIVVYIFLIGYSVLYFLTGSRFMILKAAVIVFLIQVMWVKAISRKDIIKYFLLGVCIVLLFGIGTVIRSAGNGEINLSGLSLEGIFWETGITFTSVSNMLYCCPNQIDYFYGKSLLGGILQCLPKFLRFGFFEQYTLSVSKVFSPLYYSFTNVGYGSSFIAESFYNIGYFTYLWMPFFGGILGYLDKKISQLKISGSPYGALLIVSLCGEIAFGVRSDLSSVPRILMTTSCIVILGAIMVETVLRRGKLKLRM